MTPQTMQRGAASVDPNPTAAAELAADETLARLTRAREDADTPDDAVAEHAWRQVSRLASRLTVQARKIARTLGHDRATLLGVYTPGGIEAFFEGFAAGEPLA